MFGLSSFSFGYIFRYRSGPTRRGLVRLSERERVCPINQLAGTHYLHVFHCHRPWTIPKHLSIARKRTKRNQNRATHSVKCTILFKTTNTRSLTRFLADLLKQDTLLANPKCRGFKTSSSYRMPPLRVNWMMRGFAWRESGAIPWEGP